MRLPPGAAALKPGGDGAETVWTGRPGHMGATC